MNRPEVKYFKRLEFYCDLLEKKDWCLCKLVELISISLKGEIQR